MEFITFLEALLDLVPEVAAAASFIAVVIDQLKRVGLPDGYAPLVNGVLNLVFFTILYFAPEAENDIATITGAFEVLAPYIVSIILSIVGATKVHKLLLPTGVGYSHTPKAIG